MEIDFIKDLLASWGFEHLLPLFIEQEFTIESFSNLQYECLADIFPKAGPRNLFWTKYKNHFLPNQGLSECTTMSVTTFDDYESLVSSISKESHIIPPSNNLVVINVTESVENYLKCANGIIIQNFYKQNNTLDNKNRNSLATLIINAEFNHCIDKGKFKIRGPRFTELTDQILQLFPNEPKLLYFIPYNPEKRMVARGKLWECYNYLKKKLRDMNKNFNSEDGENTSVDCLENDVALQLKFLETHFEPENEIIAAWKATFQHRQKLLENTSSTTTIDEYFIKFPIVKGQAGAKFILMDFEMKYKSLTNKLFDNWQTVTEKIVAIADSKKSPEIQLAKQQKSFDILLLCLLPFLLPHAYIKKNKNSKRMKLTKQEILDNLFIHVKDGNLLNENIDIHLANLKKFNLTFQPTAVFVGDTLDNIIASYVIINTNLYKCECPLQAVDLCFKSFQVLNANYPEGSRMIWLFIQKVVYELTTIFDADFISLNSLINEMTNK